MQMSKKRKTYSREFKRETLRLVETSDLSIAQIERDLGLSKGQVHHWKRQLARDGEEAFPGKGKLKPEDELIRQLKRENEILRQERDILKKSSGHLLAPKGVRFQFIEDHRDEFPVSRMCKMLDVSPSGYYAWRGRSPSAREMANRELMVKIETVFEESDETYGSPRVYRALKAHGVACSENRVARLMRLRGLRARQVRRFRATTKRNKAHHPAPNRLKRDFTAERPDQKWLADITYIPTLEGWLYLAAILDLFSRRIVGWAMSERMTSDLTLRALQMAIRRRRPGPGLIHHSDQGSQYTDKKYRALLRAHGIQASMNGVGSWYDNAPMESFFGTLKSERVHHCQYRTRDDASPDLFYYIEGFYNPRRLHSSLDYLSPEAHEELYRVQHRL
jgi:transposase InsO family protein/transposase-like protein